MEFSDTYRLPIKMAVETGLGFLTYGVGFFLQENVYGNPNILAPIEQGLLQGQTSLTSLGALVTINAMTNAAVTAMETEATTKKSSKRLLNLSI